MDTTLYEEKLAQATDLLAADGIDGWMLFVRETGTLTDPSLPLLTDLGFTWPAAILVDSGGRHAVIAGQYDCAAVAALGLFAEVVPYTEGIGAPLRDLLGRRNPGRIALDYSAGDSIADGLTHGMWLLLRDLLAGTPFPDRFESAEGFISRFRSIKTPAELARLRAALRTAEAIWASTGQYLQAGESEAEIAAFMLGECDHSGVTTSWERAQCPIVKAGGASITGHARPGAAQWAPGQLLNIDFGINQNGYCTDQQRMWYCRPAEGAAPPPEIQRAFDTVVATIQAGAAALRPGVHGWEVDAAARRFLTAAGYPEYKHALGHTVGRTTHDGGPLLGPRWERYGHTPDAKIEPGQVFTLELGVDTPAGYCGLEEEVLVTETGCEYLSAPQTALMFVE